MNTTPTCPLGGIAVEVDAPIIPTQVDPLGQALGLLAGPRRGWWLTDTVREDNSPGAARFSGWDKTTSTETRGEDHDRFW